MVSPRTGPDTAPDETASEEPKSSEEQQAMERRAHDFQEDPEAWLPDPGDDAAWERLADEAWTAAEAEGMNLAAITHAAETRVIEDIAWLESPRASRSGLGEYLKRRREACGLTREELAGRITVFAPPEIALVEDGRTAIFPLVEYREKALALWSKTVSASVRRVARLLGNCPRPPEWHVVPEAPVTSYLPASADEAGGVIDPAIPPRVQAVIDRLEAASEEAQEESSQV